LDSRDGGAVADIFNDPRNASGTWLGAMIGPSICPDDGLTSRWSQGAGLKDRGPYPGIVLASIFATPSFGPSEDLSKYHVAPIAGLTC